MKQSSKLVSCILPVYNAERYIGAALESLLVQTYSELEIIIINDGSNDRSLEIIEGYANMDSRVVVISRENRGLIMSLNEAIDIAKGSLIARQDADDISSRDRIERQVCAFEDNAQLMLLGTQASLIDEQGCIVGNLNVPQKVNPELFRKYNPFIHGTIMCRSEILKKMKYDPSMKFIEDYELFWRISEEYMVGNLSQRLYMYRVSPDSVSSRNIAEQVTNKYLLIEKKVYHRNYEGSHLPINRKAMLTIKIEKNVVGRAVKHGHGDITYVIGVIKSKHCPLSIKCLDYILAAFEYLKFIINDALTRIASQLHRR